MKQLEFAANLFDSALSIGNRINSYWQFFVSLNVVVVGWVLALDRSLSLDVKLVIVGTYAMALIINFAALAREYKLLAAVVAELKLRAKEEELRSSVLREFLSDVNFRQSAFLAVFLQTAFVGLVLYVIFVHG